MQGSRTDAGAALLAEQATPALTGANGGGPGLQVFAELSANLGRVAQLMQNDVERKQRAWRQIRPITGIPVGQITAASTLLGSPELAGPRSGFWWDIHLLLGATFTGGAVNVYRSAGGLTQPDLNLVGGFTSSGYLTYGKAQLMLAPGQYLVFGSNSTFTGTANLAIASVTEIAAAAVPDYLL